MLAISFKASKSYFFILIFFQEESIDVNHFYPVSSRFFKKYQSTCSSNIWHTSAGTSDKSKNLLSKTKATSGNKEQSINHIAVCVSGGKCSFFGKFGVLCFLLATVLRFAFLFYCRRYLSE